MGAAGLICGSLFAGALVVLASCGEGAGASGSRTSDRAGVERTVLVYFDALEKADGERACEQLTQAMQARASAQAGGASCPDALEAAARYVPDAAEVFGRVSRAHSRGSAERVSCPGGGPGVGWLIARRNRGLVVCGLLAGLVVVGSAIQSASAQAAAPVIVNSPNADWAETGASEDDGNRFVSVTFVARHDEGRRITQVVTSSGTFAVASQYLGTAGNSTGTNRMASSVVRFTYSPPEPTSFTCTLFGGVRRVDETLAFSVRDDLGQQSASVSQNWRVIEDDQCVGTDDFPTLESVGQSAISAVPGQNVLFTFACDDEDETGANDRCDFILWRKRRLNDGSVSGETQIDAEDNVTRSFSTSFATRGVWVVEARLCGEDSCQDPSWWRIGTVAVNEAAAPTLELTISGAGVVSGTSGYSVNQGDAADAVATVSDPGSQGAGQAIAWSSGRFDYATPQLSGGTVVQSLTSAQRTHAIDTSTSGVKSISASVFDNGAIDGADFERRQSLTDAESIHVNARPTASDISTTTPEDTAKAITLQGADADSQPAPLTYEIVSQPANGSVSLSGDTATFTPEPGFHGTTSFTYRAKDGPVSDAAWSYSNTATVSITVTPVNDPPSLASIGDKTVDEGQELKFTISATDPDGDALTYSASNLPLGASFDAATQTFIWTPGFDQAGSYANVHFEVSDGALTDFEDITITVNDIQPTTTTLSVEQSKQWLRASGEVTPSQTGEQITVTLYREVDGEFRELSSQHPILNNQSRYRIRFGRPDPGSCRIESRFPGDADTAPSQATETFDC
jgi:hypothetical protein